MGEVRDVATAFVMPKLGLTMEAGTILAWLVDDGVEVAAGTAVMLIETDKVETEVETDAAGRLHQTGLVGTSYPCTATIGWILEPGEDVAAVMAGAIGAAPAAAAVSSTGASSAPTPAPAGPAAAAGALLPEGEAARAGGRKFVSPNAHRVARELGVDVLAVAGTGQGGRVVARDVEAAARATEHRAGPGALRSRPSSGPTPPATLAARQLADLLGVDLAEVAPDERDGRISRESVARFVRQIVAERAQAVSRPAGAPPFAAPGPAPGPLAQVPTSIVPLTGMRGTIASRMKQSLDQTAQLTLMIDVDMDAVVADRTARRAVAAHEALETATPAPGYTDYIVWATARALREHPIVNSQMVDEGIALLGDIHVGLAVALERGLMVPVLRHADRLSLGEVAAETARLADAARTGKLPLADLEGGTFSISTLGMFGVDGFTPVINPPNAAILGVGRLRDEAAFTADGALGPVKRLTLSLTWDHRILDGAPAARFASSIKAALEGVGTTPP